MSGMFDENNMMQALGNYLPAGESVLAGIHACASESHVERIFSGCRLMDHGITLAPSEQGGVIKVGRSKYASYDVYLGITSHYLLIAECEEYRHYYEYEYDIDVDLAAMPVLEIHEETSLKDIGTCYPIEEIQSCEMKKGWMGSVKCNLTMKNGDYFKLIFPKLGGLGGGMPHHTEYREAIIARLNACNT